MNLRLGSIFGSAMSLCLLLNGCSSENKFLSVGTAPVGGTFYVIGNAIAQTVSNNSTELGWQVNSEATKGTQENIRRIVAGELDFGLANAAISYFAIRGEGDWKKVYQIRTVMTLAPQIALFITTESSGVKSIADLKGKRVVVGPAGAGFEYFVGPILNAHGVRFEDFTALYNTQASAVDMLSDGSAAAAFLGGAVPTSSIVQACASQDIVFVPFDENARQQLIANYPFFHEAIIVNGTYADQTEDFMGLNVGNMHLIASATEDEETVYNFTKILYEHRAEVVAQHAAGKSINANNVVKETGTPFHPGAVRYFQEIGIWPDSASN
jgi:TRAP transporter TAXI family solute receptor